MKKITALSLFILTLFTLSASAQESIIGEINYGMLEKYIDAAKEYYPKRKIVSSQEQLGRIAITTATLSYLDLFTASYFYRPNGEAASTTSTGVIPGQTGNTNLVLGNGIQYGISLNLGQFLTKPFAVRRAKIEYKVAKLQSQDFDIALITDVKRRYYTYIQSLSELKIRTQTAQDNASVAAAARRKFEKGEIQLDTYNSSRVALSESNSRQIQTEVAYLNAKDALEEIIGKKLSDIK